MTPQQIRRAPPRPPSQLLFLGESFACGTFRAPVGRDDFGDAGQPTSYQFVFPRTTVGIEPSSGPGFVADPTVVPLYNDGDAYRRTAISPQGDHADWFDVHPGVLSEMLFELGIGTYGARLFPVSHVTADPGCYVAQRRVLHHLTNAEVDPLFVEETLMQVLWGVLSSASSRKPSWSRSSLRHGQSDQTKEVKKMVAGDLAERWTLQRLSEQVGASPFQLCRWFKIATGMTLHAWIHRVRLFTALERVAVPGCDLTTIALDLGFASHSHFTNSFRTLFGLSPSQYRRGL